MVMGELYRELPIDSYTEVYIRVVFAVEGRGNYIAATHNQEVQETFGVECDRRFFSQTGDEE